MLTWLAIALGGALGAVTRHGTGRMVFHLVGPGFPWGTMAINIAGCLLMGLLIGYWARHGDPAPPVKYFLTVGFLGGFTTFSAFGLDAVTLWQRQDMIAALFYIGGSVILSLAALALGLFLMRLGISGHE